MGYNQHMTYTAILALHLALTVTTGLVGAVGIFAAVRGGRALCKRVAVFLAITAGLEIATGVILAFVSPTADPVTLGSHIAIYLGACAALEAVLVVRMKRVAAYAESI